MCGGGESHLNARFFVDFESILLNLGIPKGLSLVSLLIAYSSSTSDVCFSFEVFITGGAVWGRVMDSRPEERGWEEKGS